MHRNESFKSFANAAVKIAGVELTHRTHKYHFRPDEAVRVTTDRFGPTGNMPLRENRLVNREPVICGSSRRRTGTLSHASAELLDLTLRRRRIGLLPPLQ